MVAADDDFAGMGEAAQKRVEPCHILNRSADGHVSGKDEDVARGDCHPLVEHVGITEGDDFHGKRGVGQG